MFLTVNLFCIKSITLMFTVHSLINLDMYICFIQIATLFSELFLHSNWVCCNFDFVKFHFI